MLVNDAGEFAVDATLDGVERLLGRQFIRGQRPAGHFGTIRQDQLQTADMVDGLAVNQRMRTGGIVADHAAQGCPAGG